MPLKPADSMQSCNVCGGSRFADFRRRKGILCADCQSLERTRIIKLYLDELNLGPGKKVLHLAPEKGLAQFFMHRKVDYDPVDFDPTRYPWAPVRRLDLTTDAKALPSDHYDLVLHSHVMEHIPCNITIVLQHLHRVLRTGGTHLFCIPLLPGNFSEFLGKMSDQEATSRFGQHDHVRRFGADNLQDTLGMIFNLEESDLEARFGAWRLHSHNIPKTAWRGLGVHTVFALCKNDLRG
jgi:SAM-dependent methyltransferase